MFTSDKSISQLRKYAVLPIADHWMNGEEQINYWYKNLQSILIQEATNQIVQVKNLYHGQVGFISALKLLFMKGDAEDSECVSVCIAEIVNIDCGNDNYQVLQNNYIQNHDKKMEEMQRPEARLYLPIDEVNSEDKKPYFISSRHEFKNENDKELKIRCYVSTSVLPQDRKSVV